MRIGTNTGIGKRNRAQAQRLAVTPRMSFPLSRDETDRRMAKPHCMPPKKLRMLIP